VLLKAEGGELIVIVVKPKKEKLDKNSRGRIDWQAKIGQGSNALFVVKANSTQQVKGKFKNPLCHQKLVSIIGSLPNTNVTHAIKRLGHMESDSVKQYMQPLL
jgi:hypothetical protein